MALAFDGVDNKSRMRFTPYAGMNLIDVYIVDMYSRRFVTSLGYFVIRIIDLEVYI